MNHRLALAQRFAPRIPDTSRSYAPGGARGRARAQQITHGRRRARVGKVEPVEVYMNPGDVVKIYRKIFDSDPTIWTLGFILFSVGAQLAEIRERAADVEDVGGGSLQLRLELERRVEDLESFLSDYIRILRAMGGDETVLDGIEIAEYTQTLAEHIFVQGWPDKIDYEAGEGSEVNPLPYGLIWEISSLTNQVWAMWHPITWIGDDPDVPWWEWIPVAIAAGWVEARPTPVLVTALAEGVIEQLLVVEDQAVEAGQAVAHLIAADAELARQQAEADVKVKQAELAGARARLAQGTIRARGPAGLAHGAPVQDQPPRERVPFEIGENLHQVAFHLDGIGLVRESQAVRHALHVRVDDHTDMRAERVAEDDVGRLASDAGQREELLHGPRDLAIEFVEDAGGHPLKALGLVPVETGRAYRLLELFPVHLRIIAGRPVALEKIRRDAVHALVRALRREDGRHDQLERIGPVE